jgi:Ca2+-binding EF-hand superfamily protein
VDVEAYISVPVHNITRADFVTIANRFVDSAFFMSSEVVFSQAPDPNQATQNSSSSNILCVVTPTGFLKWLIAVGLDDFLRADEQIMELSALGLPRKRDRSWGGEGDDSDDSEPRHLSKRQETETAYRAVGSHVDVPEAEALAARLEHFHFDHGRSSSVQPRHKSKRRSRSRSAPPAGLENTDTAEIVERKSADVPERLPRQPPPPAYNAVSGALQHDLHAVLLHATWLQRCELHELLKSFEGGAGRKLTEAQVVSALQELASRYSASETEFAAIPALVRCLFTTLDQHKAGLVSSDQLCAAFSTVCPGDHLARVKAAFAAFDADGNGFIDLDEATSYLSTVFKIAARTKPEVYALLSAFNFETEKLAGITAQSMIDSADRDGDNRISQEEFIEYMFKQDATAKGTLNQLSSGAGSLVCRPGVGFHTYSASDLLESIAECADDDGFLNLDHFREKLQETVQLGEFASVIRLLGEDEQLLTMVAMQIEEL